VPRVPHDRHTPRIGTVSSREGRSYFTRATIRTRAAGSVPPDLRDRAVAADNAPPAGWPGHVASIACAVLPEQASGGRT
jgi:hypothetical protein